MKSFPGKLLFVCHSTVGSVFLHQFVISVVIILQSFSLKAFLKETSSQHTFAMYSGEPEDKLLPIFSMELGIVSI